MYYLHNMIAFAACVLSLLAGLLASGQTATASGAALVRGPDALRFVRFATDASLNTRWALFADIAHPGAPLRMVEVPASAAEPNAGESLRSSAVSDAAVTGLRSGHGLPVITAGQVVDVFRQNAAVSLHIEGVALAAGETGAKIAVRSRLSAAPLQGIIRGPGSVELLDADAPQRSRRLP